MDPFAKSYAHKSNTPAVSRAGKNTVVPRSVNSPAKLPDVPGKTSEINDAVPFEG